MATQSNYRVTVALGGFELSVTHIEWHESLSALFSCTIDVVESVYVKPSIGDADLIDKDINITLWQGNTAERQLHGVIDSVAEGGVGPRYRAYSLHITPALQRLQHTANCRIFQMKTVDVIIGEVLKQHGIIHVAFDLKKPKVQREYCVQYNETDLAFIERLAAEEGLIFYFEHQQGMHKLRFIDQIGALPVLPDTYTVRAQNANQTEASIWDFRYREQRVTSHSAQRDYTFKNPRYTLHHQHPGPFTDNQRQDYEHYSFNGRYKSDAQGKPFVQYRQEARQSAQRIATLTHDHLGFAAGMGIRIKGVSERHDHLWFNVANHLVMAQPQALQEDAVSMGDTAVQPKVTLTTTCIPWTQPWRPQPPPKPVVDGPQMAHVVGPKGEEIFCDDFGRVRVQFPWDRYGNSDEYASCWIRVAQNWAGGQYGHMAVPRIGHEVIVAFLEGDPDQPIIIGRTYHQGNLPPYPLPANKTRMTIKSKTHKGDGFNEIRFEDQADQQEIFIHAQKDQNNVVLNNETTEVGANRTENVADNETITIGGNRTEMVKKEEAITIEGNRTETVNKNEVHTIALTRTHSIGINDMLNVGAANEINVGGFRMINVALYQNRNTGLNLTETVGKNQSTDVGKVKKTVVGDEYVIKVGKCTVTMKSDGTINISGKNITLSAEGNIKLKAKKGINLKAKKDIVMKGKKILEN